MPAQSFSLRKSLALAALSATTLLLGACGNSVYHKAAQNLPGDPHDRLALRVREARAAADAAARALEKPEGSLSRGMTRAAADRVDALAWEYSRRVASVQDVVRRLPTPDLEAQQVLASLEKAEHELTAAAEKLAAEVGTAPDTDLATLTTPATSALAAAIETSDSFVNGRTNAGALAPTADKKK
ncbi:MAG TPA: hypothetical protein VD997_15475 [Phycisphaerales bacterium]|nr:hypothetical protein [Phycisphaerales bacterium]